MPENIEKAPEVKETEPKEPEMVKVPEPTEEKAEPEFSTEGLDPREVEMAREHGLIPKEKEEVKEEPEVEEPVKEEEEPKEEVKEPEAKEEKEEVKQPEKVEKPKEYTANEKAMYHLQKKERSKRQQAELERDMAMDKLKAVEDRLATLEEQLKPETAFDEDEMLTTKQYKKLQEAEAERKALEEAKASLARREKEKKALLLRAKIDEQEHDAAAKYADYNEVTQDAVEVLKSIESLNPEIQDKVRGLYNEFMESAANALNLDGGRTSAEILYEVGKLHPKHEKVEVPVRSEEVKERVDKIEKNIKKPVPSASMNSGSGHYKSVDDLTYEDIKKMSDEEYLKLPSKVRRRLLSGN